MIVTLDEVKQYLRVDYPDEDTLLESIISAAESLVADVARHTVEELHETCNDHIRISVLYAVAYLYEHREEADHHKLILNLRDMLFGVREEGLFG